ncbi:MAG: hypothetical protein LBS62_04915 [Clostridiales bacterium]|jgi:hypothetical protein|nr:hypothetical protein [Clostridiales bacterium]
MAAMLKTKPERRMLPGTPVGPNGEKLRPIDMQNVPMAAYEMLKNPQIDRQTVLDM